MLKTALVGLACLVGSGVAGAQQLTYTTHVELRRVESPAQENPILASLYARLGGLIGSGFLRRVPGGAIDWRTTLSEEGLRIEANKEVPFLPQGTVQFIHPDASATFVTATTRTYWRTDAPPESALARTRAAAERLRPSIQSKRTGEIATIAGIRAERVAFTATLNPEGMPSALLIHGPNLEIAGDIWLAPQYKAETALLSRYAMAPNAVPRIFSEVAADGFPLRMILRGDLFGGYEYEQVVTEISSAATPSAFQIPADYTEVSRAGPSVQPPKVLRRIEPQYTAEAMRARIEGAVVIEAIVGTDGTVQRSRVLRSLDPHFGLDEAALKAVQQWLFTPANVRGSNAPVVVIVQVAFKIRMPPDRTAP